MKRQIRAIALASVALSIAAPSRAQSVQAKQFGARETVRDLIGDPALWREASPAQNAARIKAPVILFHGDLDLNVAVNQSRMMASKLKGAGRQVEYAEYNGLDHQLDDSKVRTELLDRIDRFLRASMKLPPNP